MDLRLGMATVTNAKPSGARVLVVEDEMMLALMMEDMLADIGHTPVGPATRVENALKLVDEGGFDAAILDIKLDGQDSYPVADALTAHAIPFVFASGYSAGRLHEKYRGVPSVQKPFLQSELERVLDSALNSKARV